MGSTSGIAIDYIRVALLRATFEVMEGDEGFLGVTPGCRGVWANEATSEACRDELQSVLEDWTFVKLRHNDADFTEYHGQELNPRPPVEDESLADEPIAAPLTGAA